MQDVLKKLEGALSQVNFSDIDDTQHAVNLMMILTKALDLMDRLEKAKLDSIEVVEGDLNISEGTMTTANSEHLLILKSENKPEHASWSDILQTIRDFKVIKI